jgi:GntR family transcriptional regulator
MIDDSRPVYLRLRDELVSAILDGRFADGDPLPSVRAFAADQGANPLTVSKAYQTLQDDGVVTVKRGVGMFVAKGAAGQLRESERAYFLNAVWPPVLAQMKRVGLNPADLLDRVAG